MIEQYITVADDKWHICICYGVSEKDYSYIIGSLMKLGCGYTEAKDATDTVCYTLNTGFTFSNLNLLYSLVCISRTSNDSETVNTVAHELKHVQSHICQHYEVDEDTEEAAYLVGYIAKRVFKVLSKLI